MSRLLMATPSRLPINIRTNRLKNFLNITRQLTGKSTSKSGAGPKCAPKVPPKPKPGYFSSGGTHAVFSDLPKPEGDFMKHWNAKNAKYNMMLLSGVAALVGTIAFTYSSGVMPLNATVPDYPYTDDEMEEFAKEEQHRQEEREERERRRENLLDAKELKIRRRKAKDAMEREVQLMQKDIDEGISDQEMDELVKLAQAREEFESWEKQELKRLDDKEKEREKVRKEKEKAKKEDEKQREKEQKAKEKAAKAN